jgi:hypothetical protein
MFWVNEEYATGLADIVLDGVVCVVDAVFGQQVCPSTFFPLSRHLLDSLANGRRSCNGRLEHRRKHSVCVFSPICFLYKS